MNEIEILCPGSKCRKCQRMITRIEEASSMLGIDATIEIIHSLDEILTYNTWILPTLVINQHVVARGYVPSLQQVLKHIRVSNSIAKL